MEHKFSIRKALSLIVVLAMVLSTVAAFAFTASADDEQVLKIDAINAASWGEDAVKYGAILVYGTEKNVGEYIGGVWNSWWYKITAAYDEETGLFTVTNKAPGDGDQSYAAVTLAEGEVMILVYAGAEATDTATAATAAAVEIGDTLKADGFDFTNESASDMLGADLVASVYFTIVEATEVEPEAPAEMETIVIDGNIDDNGWTEEFAAYVDGETGFWQALPTTDDTLEYAYCMRTDDTKLYVAVVIDCELVEGGNGNGTNVRLWINSDSEYKLYTHFYDVFAKDGAVAYNAKYNTAKDANTGANIEDSSIDAAINCEDGITFVEFSVDLAEFNGEEGFAFYMCVSNKVNENICLYNVQVPLGEDDNRGTNLPWKAWYFEGDCEVDVEALKLGEVKEEGGDVVESYNIALDATYTSSEQFRMGGKEVNWGYDPNAAIVYEDENGCTMNDGILPDQNAEYTDPAWAGWTGAHPNIESTTGYNWLTFDLGESADLAQVVVWFGNLGLGNGIGAPNKLEVFVSDDGENWGEAVATVEPEKIEGLILDNATLDFNASGRYVQIRIHNGTWSFLAEVEIWTAGSEGEEPEIDLEEVLKILAGEKNENAKFDLVITAPETYEAGDEITVTVEVKNITAENGLHLVKFEFYYDYEKLLLLNDLDEYDNNCVDCFNAGEALPNKWTNFTKVNNDYDPNGSDADNEVVEALNDGVIYCSVLTTQLNPSFAVKEDGALTFTFKFKVLEDAEGDIGMVIPGVLTEGALNTKDGADVYEGNGAYAIVKTIVEDEPSKPADPVVPGDASSMLVFAIIALVAIAGSAIVVKTRK